MRVDGHKRTLMLPPALGDYRPAGAAFEDGASQVTFDGPARAEPPTPSPTCATASARRRRPPSAWRARGGAAPQGWASRADGAGSGPRAPTPASPTSSSSSSRSSRSLRELVPPELQQQVTDLIRQILLLVRALLDRVIEHLEPTRGTEPDVEDIPIS